VVDLSHIHATTLKFDVSGYAKDGLCRYALDSFRIGSGIADQEEIDALTEHQPGKLRMSSWPSLFELDRGAAV